MQQSIALTTLFLLAGQAAAECFSASYVFRPYPVEGRLQKRENMLDVEVYEGPWKDGSEDTRVCTYAIDDMEIEDPTDVSGFMDCEDGYEASFDNVYIDEDEWEVRVTLKNGDDDLQEIVFDHQDHMISPVMGYGTGRGEVDC